MCLSFYSLWIHSVDTLLHICGLWSRRHAMVGSLGLEYAKRTTIAVELAAKVGITFKHHVHLLIDVLFCA